MEEHRNCVALKVEIITQSFSDANSLAYTAFFCSKELRLSLYKIKLLNMAIQIIC